MISPFITYTLVTINKINKKYLTVPKLHNKWAMHYALKDPFHLQKLSKLEHFI